MTDRKSLPGKFVWFEHASRNPERAQAFYSEVLGWRVKPFPMGHRAYDMILTGDSWDTMIGGYAAPADDHMPARWIATMSVEDVDAAVRAAVANGGQVVDTPTDLPGVGRTARISDPQGAELGLLSDGRGDKADAPVPPGGWLWCELRTNEIAKALFFYETVLGVSHRSLDMGASGLDYHVLSSQGVGRGGATGRLPTGMSPHWLPYVCVDDVDATIACAIKLGARVPIAPEDIPGIGRSGVIEDPTGAQLAIMKPLPRQAPTAPDTP